MMNGSKVAIVGGGVAGLACAWQLRRLLPDCQLLLFELRSELGGVLQTDFRDGFLLERSADMFTSDPPFAVEMVEQLGRTGELIGTQPVADRAWLAVPPSDKHPRGLAAMPRGLSLLLPSNPLAVAESGILDQAGVRRFLQEKELPPRISEEDESLQDFVERRFGTQAFERLFQPLVSGIYTADPRKLSMQATMSRFLKMEREYGSLLAAAEALATRSSSAGQSAIIADHSASGARYDLFRAPARGMGQLIQWIVDDLNQVDCFLNSEVVDLNRKGAGWSLGVRSTRADSATIQSVEVDAVVLATSATVTAQFIQQIDSPELGAGSRDLLVKELQAIPFASCAVVVLGFEDRRIRNPFSGYGIVVPAYLNRKLIAVSFSSNKFDGRAPRGTTLVRCFMGGALQRHDLEMNDQELIATAIRELNDWLQIQGDPLLQTVFRWSDAMPQYHLRHSARVEQINRGICGIKGLFLAGNSYTGVGIPVCIGQGRSTAELVVEFLRTARTDRESVP
jgi:oxygen-dependent protoporphyrinogen oxidase